MVRIHGLLNRPPIGYARFPLESSNPEEQAETIRALWGTRVQSRIYDAEGD